MPTFVIDRLQPGGNRGYADNFQLLCRECNRTKVLFDVLEHQEALIARLEHILEHNVPTRVLRWCRECNTKKTVADFGVRTVTNVCVRCAPMDEEVKYPETTVEALKHCFLFWSTVSGESGKFTLTAIPDKPESLYVM